MNTIFENERITIDIDDTETKYRISSFDKNCHYDDEIILDSEQMNYLKLMLEKIQLNVDDEFD